MKKDLLELAIKAALQAGNKIMDIYQSDDFEIQLKSDDSPLTKADMASHTIIEYYLKDTQIPLLSEEGKHIPYEQRQSWSQLWIVDPIDGTKEFIKTDDNGAFTFNIGLIENGLPVLGMVYAPARNAFYWGHQGGGAFCREATRITPITVRDVPNSGVVAVASASHLDAATTNWLAVRQINQTTSIGSSLKFTLVASGQADVYPRFGPTMEWDTAAGDAVLRAAGGMVFHPDGEIYRYGKKDYRNTPFIAYGQLTPLTKV